MVGRNPVHRNHPERADFCKEDVIDSGDHSVYVVRRVNQTIDGKPLWSSRELWEELCNVSFDHELTYSRSLINSPHAKNPVHPRKPRCRPQSCR